MSPRRQKWLARVSILLVIVGLALIVLGEALAAPVLPPRIGAGPVAHDGFTVYASANNTTKNGTANNTIAPCSPQANDYCYRQLVQVWSSLLPLRDELYVLQVALSIAVAVILILVAAVFKYAHDGTKKAMTSRLEPDNPETWAEIGALIEHAVGEPYAEIVHEKGVKLMTKKIRALKDRAIRTVNEE